MTKRKEIQLTDGKGLTKINKTQSLCDHRIKMVPPDGGYGWVVVCCGFISILLAYLSLNSFGILFQSIFIENKTSSSKIAWIFTIYSFCFNAVALLIGPLCQEFGRRRVAVIGGLFNFFSFFVSAFVTKVDYLFLTFSFCGGIGASIGTLLSLLIVSDYFEKKKGLSMGFVSLGSCIGVFISPLLVKLLQDIYGYKAATIICSGIILNQCVCGLLFHPVKWYAKKVIEIDDTIICKKKLWEEEFSLTKFCTHEKKCSASLMTMYPSILSLSKINIPSQESQSNEKSKKNFLFRFACLTYTNLKILKNMRAILISVASANVLVASVNFQIWIPFVVLNANYSLQDAAWCLSWVSIGNFCGRTFAFLLADRPWFKLKEVYMMAITFIGTIILSFSFVTELRAFMWIAALFGASFGTLMSLHFLLMIKTMGEDLFSACVGVTSLFQALFSLALGPIFGAIRDATSSYQYALIFIAGMVYLAAFLWLLMPLAKKYDDRNRVKDYIEDEHD